jgi:hypothetical protein
MAAKKKTALTDFLKKISTDKRFHARFLKEPDKTMKAAGLSKAQIAIVKSRDPQQLSQAIVAEQFKPGATAAIVIVGVLDFTVE